MSDFCVSRASTVHRCYQFCGWYFGPRDRSPPLFLVHVCVGVGVRLRTISPHLVASNTVQKHTDRTQRGLEKQSTLKNWWFNRFVTRTRDTKKSLIVIHTLGPVDTTSTGGLPNLTIRLAHNERRLATGFKIYHTGGTIGRS